MALDDDLIHRHHRCRTFLRLSTRVPEKLNVAMDCVSVAMVKETEGPSVASQTGEMSVGNPLEIPVACSVTQAVGLLNVG